MIVVANISSTKMSSILKGSSSIVLMELFTSREKKNAEK